MALIRPDDPRLPEIVARLRAGTTSLLEESRRLGYSHNGPLRNVLRKRLGTAEYAGCMRANAARRAPRLQRLVHPKQLPGPVFPVETWPRGTMSRIATAFGYSRWGARSGDSFTVAVAHLERGKAVLDAIREVVPPFDPNAALTSVVAPLCARYGVTTVRGDQVSRGFVESNLRSLGLTFDTATLTTSDLYLQLLALVNAGQVELLDDATLRLQLLSLQRSQGQGGKDRVSHPSGGHDDVATAAAGAVALAVGLTAGKGDGQTFQLIFGGSSEKLGKFGAGANVPTPLPEVRNAETMQAWRDAERMRMQIRARDSLATYAQRFIKRL